MSTPDSPDCGPENAAWCDPELAILRELEVDFLRESRALADGRVDGAERDHRRRSERGRRHYGAGLHVRAVRDEHSARYRRPVRITRRALILVALVSLVGASALADHSVLSGSSSSSSPSSGPDLLGSGGPAAERWQLQAYIHEGSLCEALFTNGTVASACTAKPGPKTVHALSALGSYKRFVGGLAGAAVAQVLVRVGDHTEIVSTHAVVSRPSASLSPSSHTVSIGGGEAANAISGATRLPAGLRWFVAVLPGESANDAVPALLVPRDRSGRALGDGTLDCSLGASSPVCRRMVEGIAPAG